MKQPNDPNQRHCVEPDCAKIAVNDFTKEPRCAEHLSRAWNTGATGPMAPHEALQKWLEIWGPERDKTDPDAARAASSHSDRQTPPTAPRTSMPEDSRNYHHADYDITDFINTVADTPGHLDFVVAKHQQDGRASRKIAIVSFANRTFAIPWRSNPAHLIRNLFAYGPRTATVNGQPVPKREDQDSQPASTHVRAQRQKGDISDGATSHETHSNQTGYPRLVHRGLHFIVPDRWSDEHRPQPDQPDNNPVVDVPDPDQQHPNYGANITVAIRPAYTLDESELTDFRYFSHNDQPIIVPNMANRLRMADQLHQHLDDALAWVAQAVCAAINPSDYRFQPPGALPNGDTLIGNEHRVTRANLREHAIPTIVQAGDRALKYCLQDALMRQSEHPYVPVEYHEAVSRNATAPAYARCEAVSIAGVRYQLDGFEDHPHPADGLVPSIEYHVAISRLGEQTVEIAVPAAYHMAGEDDHPLFYAVADLSLHISQLEDRIFSYLWDQADNYLRESAFYEACHQLAVNQSQPAQKAFVTHLAEIAQGFRPGLPQPQKPVTVHGDGFTLTWAPAGNRADLPAP